MNNELERRLVVSVKDQIMKLKLIVSEGGRDARTWRLGVKIVNEDKVGYSIRR